MQDDADADEERWIELIIESDRVAGWVDGIRSGKKSAVLQLQAAVAQRPIYAEEVGIMGSCLGDMPDHW